MVLDEQIMIKCPCCGWKFLGKLTRDYQPRPIITGRSTDFRPLAENYSFLLNRIEACVKCGFAYEVDDFEEQNLSKDLKEKIKSASQEREDKELTPQEKCSFYAKTLFMLDAPVMEVAGAYLHASWACAVSNDVAGATENRREAVKYFVSALKNSKLPNNDKAKFTYLVGELYRRIGEVGTARRWFNRVWSVLTDPDEQSWIMDLANKQKGNYPADKLTEEELCGFKDGGRRNTKIKRHNDLFENIRRFFRDFPGIQESVKKERINYWAKKDRASRIMAFLSDKNGILIGLTRHFIDSDEEFHALVDELKKEEEPRERIIKEVALMGFKKTIEELPRMDHVKIRPHDGGVNILIDDEVHQDSLHIIFKIIRYSLLHKLLVCPKCQGKRVATILYGLLRYDEDLKRDIEMGRVRSGGCCLRSEKWHCLDCELEW